MADCQHTLHELLVFNVGDSFDFVCVRVIMKLVGKQRSVSRFLKPYNLLIAGSAD